MARNAIRKRGGRSAGGPRGNRGNPLDAFVDDVLGMLDTAVSTMVFGAGAVLLGKVLGAPRAPDIEIPPGVPPQVEAEWRRLASLRMGVAGGGAHSSVSPPPAQPQPKTVETVEIVQLAKGEDGVYRPEPERGRKT